MKLNAKLLVLLVFSALIFNKKYVYSSNMENKSKNKNEEVKKRSSDINIHESDVEKNTQETIASYEAHAHNIPKEGSHNLFNLYSKGLIEGEAKDDLLHGGPIYWEGWGKFFHYQDEADIKKPHDFFANNEYYHQLVLKKDYLKRDDTGYINIPSKFHFFFSVNSENVVVLSSRNRKLHKVIDTLHINLINPIASDNPDIGGVQNLGEFDEGNCIQVLTHVPDQGPDPNFKVTTDTGGKENWVFCLDSIKERSELLKTLRKIKILKQKASGDHYLADSRKPSISKVLRPKKTALVERYNGPDANKYKDGYWVLLQDWSQCTLKCGGGVQTQQWLCQPPLKGGKPCQGHGVRKRPCNLQPCPRVLAIEDDSNKRNIEVIKKPIIRSLPWSSRLQRYIQCEIKESDILYIRRDIPNLLGKPIKYPGRLVMTNRTLAMYEDDSFKHALFTFNLADTTLSNYEKDYCCFFAMSMDKKFRICGFEDTCGSKTEPRFVTQWIKDFNLFQKKCFVDLPKKNWKDEVKRAEEDSDGGHIEADQDKVDARENLIRRNIKEKQDLELEKKITTTEETALRAIRKELKLERLLKREVKIKEKEKIKDLLNLKVKEEKKQECLERALRARENENNKGRDNILAEREIAKIKANAKKEVQGERANLRKKILDYKRRANRKEKLLEQQINLVRSKMAKNLVEANKNGDMMICKNSQNDPQLINRYCDTSFVTNYKKNLNCKDIETFCYTCCENEFGPMYLEKRDECYNLCDEGVRSDLKGDWIWTKQGFYNK